MQSKSAIIYNIQRFSIHDGPGIRTVVFFKGCNLRCKWCHNPESISQTKQLEFYSEKCIGCGKCFKICKNNCHYLDDDNNHCINRTNCTACFECVNSCYAEALVGVGNNITTDQLMKSILTDLLYYKNSNGGVTFSGGESMLNIDFLKDILMQCKKHGIHTAIDTAGNVPFANFERILNYTDLFLYDVKAADSFVHKNLTGVGNELILSNLNKLSELKKNIIVRVPFIPKMNSEELAKIALILKDLNLIQTEILGYHKLGDSKYSALNIANPTSGIISPTKKELQDTVNYFKENNINTI